MKESQCCKNHSWLESALVNCASTTDKATTSCRSTKIKRLKSLVYERERRRDEGVGRNYAVLGLRSAQAYNINATETNEVSSIERDPQPHAYLFPCI